MKIQLPLDKKFAVKVGRCFLLVFIVLFVWYIAFFQPSSVEKSLTLLTLLVVVEFWRLFLKIEQIQNSLNSLLNETEKIN